MYLSYITSIKSSQRRRRDGSIMSPRLVVRVGVGLIILNPLHLDPFCWAGERYKVVALIPWTCAGCDHGNLNLTFNHHIKGSHGAELLAPRRTSWGNIESIRIGGIHSWRWFAVTFLRLTDGTSHGEDCAIREVKGQSGPWENLRISSRFSIAHAWAALSQALRSIFVGRLLVSPATLRMGLWCESWGGWSGRHV
jgi:hypothetical protein